MGRLTFTEPSDFTAGERRSPVRVPPLFQDLRRPDVRRVPNFNMRPPQWVGFPPYPLWWVWAGPRLVPEIGRFLGPEATERAGGLFRAFSDSPLDRRELAEVLGPDNLPWIPVEYSATYSDEYMEMTPLAVATVIPEALRNREPLDLPPGIYNPPRKLKYCSRDLNTRPL